jgi:arylsulfatase A-like enzyme
LRGRDRRRPFFAQVSFQRPHAPLSPSPEQADLYQPEDVDLPASALDAFERGHERAFASKPPFQRAHVARHGGSPFVLADADELRRHLAFYYTLITVIDEQIGRLIAHLAETGDLANTVIVYVADHGDFAGDHGLMQKNFGIYESIHRIPFLLAYPGCTPGARSDALVESVDLYPTLCALMELPLPPGRDGRSLLPILAGVGVGRDAAFCEWSWTRPTPMIHAVRTPEFRLVYYGWGEPGELYDRRRDPDERDNVYDHPDFRDVRLRLTEHLLGHVIRYEKKTDSQRDRRLAQAQRSTLTRLVHLGGRRWSELAAYHTPPDSG